jgi:hypothetical protein
VHAGRGDDLLLDHRGAHVVDAEREGDLPHLEALRHAGGLTVFKALAGSVLRTKIVRLLTATVGAWAGRTSEALLVRATSP